MTTHSSIRAWKIPRTEDPGELQSMGLQESRTQLATEQQHQTLILIKNVPTPSKSNISLPPTKLSKSSW